MRRSHQPVTYDLIRRHHEMQVAADQTVEALVALGMERRDAAYQVNDTLKRAQRLIEKAAPQLTPERHQAIYFRVQSYLQEVLDITNRTAEQLQQLRDK